MKIDMDYVTQAMQSREYVLNNVFIRPVSTQTLEKYQEGKNSRLAYTEHLDMKFIYSVLFLDEEGSGSYKCLVTDEITLAAGIDLDTLDTAARANTKEALHLKKNQFSRYVRRAGARPKHTYFRDYGQ